VIASVGVLAAAADTFPSPDIDYAGVSPMLVVFGFATLGVLFEAVLPARWRQLVQLPAALLGLVGGFVAVALLAGAHRLAAEGAVAVDGPTLFLQGTILSLAFASMLLVGEPTFDDGGGSFTGQAAAVPGSEDARTGVAERRHTEVYPLAMFAVGGMLLFPAANDLLTMFVALEVLSLPLYLLCGLARRRRLLSQEAALKYFLLGAFSSAFFLYGLALVYGYAGSVRLGDIADAVSTSPHGDALLIAGVALIAVGLLFKLSAAPFHSWTPDVYQGAPTPVTALMASGTKVAAFGALLRVFYVAFGGLRWDWRPLMWAIAILTMVVGSVLAITQTDVKRMLAYSSIAHAGFLLLGVIATSERGLAGTLFYLLVYGFTTLGAFAIVTLVRDADGEATHLSRWRGLGRRSPIVGGIFALFLLALAGIPMTSGFMGKYAVFSAAIAGGATPLVVVGVVMSAVAAFFYVRVIVLMFFNDPAPDGPTVVIPSGLTAAAVALGLAVTVVLGVLPQPVLDLADQAANGLFVR
jgi:NADH-quinone oxidoreductase subunit N